jgi:hypothetical protein
LDLKQNLAFPVQQTEVSVSFRDIAAYVDVHRPWHLIQQD